MSFFTGHRKDAHTPKAGENIFRYVLAVVRWPAFAPMSANNGQGSADSGPDIEAEDGAYLTKGNRKLVFDGFHREV